MNYKKTLLFFTLSVLVSGKIVLAQNNTIKLDLRSAVSGIGSIAYERRLNDFLTAQLAVEYGSYGDGVVSGKRDYLLMGFNVIPEIRYYPFHKKRQAPFGFFIGESYRYSQYTETYYGILYGSSTKREFNSTVTNISLVTGYKYNYRKFSIEGELAYGLIDEVNLDPDRKYYLTNYDDWIKDGGQGFVDELGNLRIKISLGYTFGYKLNKEK